MDASGDVLSKSERTRLLEAVLKAERFNEASRLVRSWLPDSPPSPNVLKFYTSKLSSTGDVEAFDQYGQLLNQELQKIVSFENKRITCLLAAGKGGDELDRWEKAIDLATTQEEIDRVCTKFPRGGVLGILDKYPECIPQYEKIVDKFNDKGYNGAANTLFIYYFCHSQIDKAKAVYDKYLANSSRLMFQSIMTKARKNNDVHILTELKQMIKDSPAVTPGVVGHLCSTIINICCSEEKYDEALSQLEECLKTCSIENITPASLLKLKTGLEQNNKTFKYTIPDKKLAANKDDSTSSSSSDDEKKPAQSMQ